MSLASMTGFARAQGSSGSYSWAWELKSVNAKGLDFRLRLPQGWDSIELPVRAALSRSIARGTITGTLTVDRIGAVSTVKVNEDVLASLIETIGKIAKRMHINPPSLDGILGLKGVIEVVESEENEEDRRRAESAIISGYEKALADLVQMRRNEGTILVKILSERIDQIAKLTAVAAASPSRTPEAIRTRLAEQVKALSATSEKFDLDRLHQEAILLATKADICEELDRLVAHVDATRKLLSGGLQIGRKLDFLAQELHRESNTLCAKASDVSLVAIGLDLKAAVEQFREQVQNLE
jgi:uncharacterized protein (TIGR00255 family)